MTSPLHPPPRPTAVAVTAPPPRNRHSTLLLRVQEDPKELVRKWQRQIRTETRGVERQMLGRQAGTALAGKHAPKLCPPADH